MSADERGLHEIEGEGWTIRQVGTLELLTCLKTENRRRGGLFLARHVWHV